MDSKVALQINQQIQKELYSAYLYLDIANYYNNAGLNGFENWFFVQAQEERDHALLFRTFLLNNEQSISLLPLEAPAAKYGDFAAPLHAALQHEQYITSSIHTIYETASAAKDFRSVEFLNWFIKEQGEEEKNVHDLIQKYDLFGKDPKGLYSLDQELGGRVYAAPSLVLD